MKPFCISNKFSKPLFHYTYGDYLIKSTYAVHYLGVTFNTHIRWNHYCKSVSSKATKCFNVLLWTIFGCSNKAKSIAFSFLVPLILDYASPVLWSSHSKQKINLLESLLYHGPYWVCNTFYPLACTFFLK